jgi:hypothetical protein
VAVEAIAKVDAPELDAMTPFVKRGNIFILEGDLCKNSGEDPEVPSTGLVAKPEI